MTRILQGVRTLRRRLPGLAITLSTTGDPENPVVAIPYEFNRETIHANDRVLAVGTNGEPLAEVR